MKLLIMQFLQPPVTSSLFGPDILLSTLLMRQRKKRKIWTLYEGQCGVKIKGKVVAVLI
jgi:hypothetical protein